MQQVQQARGFIYQRVFHVLASILIFFAILYIGQPLFVPLAFALLISFILYPLAAWQERMGVRKLWATIWTVLSVSIVLLGIIFLFSSQLVSLSDHFGNFAGKMNELLGKITRALNKLPFVEGVSSEQLVDRGKQWISETGANLMTGTISVTGAFISGLVLTAIYTFLILLYRTGFREAFLKFANKENRNKYETMFANMQKVGKKYLTGMFLLIIILGLLNSIGLWILGIEYPFFFGFLASSLAIIPYVGTTLGGAIPALYALMNYESLWYPVGVVLIFIFIQFIEGNFLTPKIIGGNLQLNALIAILSLIAGGLLWGVAGMILFLPYTAIFKEVCEGFPPLKPMTVIMGDDLYEPGRSG